VDVIDARSWTGRAGHQRQVTPEALQSLKLQVQSSDVPSERRSVHPYWLQSPNLQLTSFEVPSERRSVHP
jgi:hypothetical protein